MRKYNGGQWTPSRYQSFIKSALRSASIRWPPKFKALNSAFVDKRVNEKTGRVGKHYRCAKCHNIFPTSQVQVDHIKPVVPETGFKSWDEVIGLMFCEEDGFQVLCTDCHQIKTKEENVRRRKNTKQT